MLAHQDVIFHWTPEPTAHCLFIPFFENGQAKVPEYSRRAFYDQIASSKNMTNTFLDRSIDDVIHG